MYAQAISELQTANQLSGGAGADPSPKLAYVYMALGERAKAQKILDELMRTPQSDNRPLQIAKVFMALGEKDRTIEWLERAYQQRSFGMFFLKVDPDFDSLRSDPRFMQLLQRTNLAP